MGFNDDIKMLSKQEAEELQRQAYGALTQLFAKYARLPRAKPDLVIEILPPDIQPPDGASYLEDESERSIGIPRKVLSAAFLEALRIFANRHDLEDSAEILTATQIILLSDPEYLTAANYRKRVLLATRRDRPRFLLQISVEQRLLDSILNSPLHRQSKSPTLWYHRYWLLLTHDPCENLRGGLQKLGDLIQSEMDAVLRAAEQHQHNYYAFQYGRRALAYFMTQGFDADSPEGAEAKRSAIRALASRMLKWCKSHPADTSGWSFLLSLMQPPFCQAYPEHSPAIIRSVLNFAVNLHWQGEALWYFLYLVSSESTDILADEENRLRNDVLASAQLILPMHKRPRDGKWKLALASSHRDT